MIRHRDRVAEAIARCREVGIGIALFIDPDVAQVEASRALGADAVELHTGRYADAADGEPRNKEFESLRIAGECCVRCGMALHAGHGLNYQNVHPVARLDRMAELNIGHSIVSRSIFVGLERAVREMKVCLGNASEPPLTSSPSKGLHL